MSYKDLEEARAKRATKKKASAGKEKPGLKRKSPAPEPEPEPEAEASLPKVVKNLLVPKDQVVGMSEVEPGKTPRVLWRAPVAQIY